EIEQGGINRKGQTISTGIKTKSLCFGIHVPYEKEEKGYAFSFTVTPENKLILVWQANNSLGYITEDQYNLTEENQEDELSKQMFRLAVNTIVYMHTFPNCIVDGVPNITKEEKSFTVEIAEKVLSSDANTGKIVSPHFRKGYFKILRSDFYTHKKGQSVFVKETMVNGKAKTVYTADNLEEILDN
ncbi:MAG: hypothetical protein K5839_03780, partial [Treponemataceae bacterium]|nr:hypothetical protein [Treponemataceae bacterium]